MKRKLVLRGIVSICTFAALLFTACTISVRYTVTFKAGTGTGTPPARQKGTAGTVIILPGQGRMIPPEGQYFGGWKTGEKTYKAQEQSIISAETEFTAQWTSQESSVSYTVTFKTGTGTGTPPAQQKVAAKTAITLPEQGAMIAPKDHSFDGWKTGTQTYAAKASFTVAKDTEFTAQWKSIIDPDKSVTARNATEMEGFWLR